MTAFFCPDESSKFNVIANAIADTGWCRLDHALSPLLLAELARTAAAFEPEELKKAGIGPGGDAIIDRSQRSDRIRWINGSSEVEQQWLQWMERLRLHLNRELFLGLFNYESHFSRYLPGDYYRRHLDAFRGGANRRLSSVLYLNDDWQPEDGGNLVIYQPTGHPAEADTEIARIEPHAGTLVLFLSEEFPHEVLPALKARHSIAGWFRVNGSAHDRADPAR